MAMRTLRSVNRLSPAVGLLVAGLLLWLPVPAHALTVEDARHLLARTGFAADPAAIARLLPLSRDAAVAAILAGADRHAITAPPDWVEGWQPPPKPMHALDESERRLLRQERREQAIALKAWWYQEMIATPTPLTEVMTLFWHNHFTSGLRKVKAPALLYRQNQLLRRHALGNFATLLRDIARDPAMLIYLDGAKSHREAPNENFARELLELFTLGEGHYTEADIKAAARAFTGWSVDRRTGRFTLRAAWHDSGMKRFLGHDGRFDGDDIIDIVLRHPRTAEHLTAKLWRRFVSDAPPPDAVKRIAEVFRASGYEIKPLMAALLTTPAFWDRDTRGRLIKSPVELMVGIIRQFDVPVDRPVQLVHAGRRLGQDLFDPPSVKGWPGGTAWITTETILQREALLARVTGMPPGGDEAMAVQATDRREKRSRELLANWLDALPDDWRNAAAVVTLLLPVPPVDAAILDRDASGALVRSLLIDPVFQLK